MKHKLEIKNETIINEFASELLANEFRNDKIKPAVEHIDNCIRNLAMKILGYETMNEEKALNTIKLLETKYNCNLTVTKADKGRVQTHVPDDTKPSKRKNIKAKDIETLAAKLIEHFKNDSSINIRFCDIFEEWLEYKGTVKKNKSATIKQNRATYIKYVKGTELDTMRLIDVKPTDYMHWASSTIDKFNLKQKSFNNHKLVVYYVFSYARQIKGMDVINLYAEKYALGYAKDGGSKSPQDLVFFPDELQEFITELLRGYETNGNIANIALLINFDLGLRVGELSALKWTDVDWKEETIYIQRMEDSSDEVVEHVKSDSKAGYRVLDLTPPVLAILKYLYDKQSSNEYIFCDSKGERTSNIKLERRCTNARITIFINNERAAGREMTSTICKAADSPFKAKGTHCIRRTYASRLRYIDELIIEKVQSLLGHSDPNTTKAYVMAPYSRKDDIEACKGMSTLQYYLDVLRLPTSVYKCLQ